VDTRSIAVIQRCSRRGAKFLPEMMPSWAQKFVSNSSLNTPAIFASSSKDELQRAFLSPDERRGPQNVARAAQDVKRNDDSPNKDAKYTPKSVKTHPK